MSLSTRRLTYPDGIIHESKVTQLGQLGCYAGGDDSDIHTDIEAMAHNAEGSEGVAEPCEGHKGRKLVVAAGMGHMVLQPPNPEPRRIRNGPEHRGGGVEGCQMAGQIDGLGGFVLPCADDEGVQVWLGFEEETQHCGVEI